MTLALLYTQAGLPDLAEAELRALQTANPASVAVRRLQVSLRTLRRFAERGSDGDRRLKN